MTFPTGIPILSGENFSQRYSNVHSRRFPVDFLMIWGGGTSVLGHQECLIRPVLGMRVDYISIKYFLFGTDFDGHNFLFGKSFDGENFHFGKSFNSNISFLGKSLMDTNSFLGKVLMAIFPF